MLYANFNRGVEAGSCNSPLLTFLTPEDSPGLLSRFRRQTFCIAKLLIVFQFRNVLHQEVK